MLQQRHGPVFAVAADAVGDAVQLQDVAVGCGDVVDLGGVTEGLNELSLREKMSHVDREGRNSISFWAEYTYILPQYT